ncbi:uncharacterized protein LOC143848142 [Tasmannia lanceolata]|uniref:uncharacterized protein LOC143848142 n=1 Tax=Tasmannia lanceolata TaxID=3420 RepID=UPI004063C243
MDLNMTTFFFPENGELNCSYTEIGHIPNCGQSDNLGDTALRLDCLGYGMSKTAKIGSSQCSLDILSTQVSDDGCRLVLGLGPTPSVHPDDYYPIAPAKIKEGATLFGQRLALDSGSQMLQLGLSRARDDSPSYLHNPLPSNEKRLLFPIVDDEGSTSSKRKSGGYIPSLLLAPRLESSKCFPETHGILELGPTAHSHLQFSPEPQVTTDCSVGTISDTVTSGGLSSHRSHHPKKCRFKGCSKGARGASGLCIAHGGGERCQKPGCNKGAESRTAYCKAHGGGRRCQRLGCTKSAEGKTEYCIAHGGGRRCGHPGCLKAARGKSGLCIRHGGGKRCTVEGCSRSAEGQAGLCISHGGGRRCQNPGCNKGAQGSTLYCKAHGGGKRCVFAGCTKGAEGSTPLCKGHGGGKRCLFDGGGICPKSVHGGTDYCVAHGGGKRCAVPGCTKSARGRTDCCVRHGGGKRCQFENCGKSAQGSTDFCKAHGGGKRCTWGQGTCEKFSRGKSGLCAAHGSMIREDGLIGPGLFNGVVSASTVGSSLDNDCSLGASAVSDCAESSENAGRRQQLIPPQVLVPMSMKSNSFSGLQVIEREEEGGKGGNGSKNINYLAPEGRVHGGSLMSLLGGNLKNAVDGM